MSNVLDYGVNGSFGSTVGGTGTLVKYFPRPLGPSIGVAPLTPSATSAVGALLLPAANSFNAQQFNVIATGTFGNDTGDPSATVTVQLYAVTGSLKAPVYTSIATTGAMTPSPFGVVNNWAISAELFGSSQSGNPGGGFLGGSYISYQNGAIKSSVTTTTNVISGLDFNVGNPALAQGAVLGFVVGVTFATSDASNTANLLQFTVES